MRKLILLSGVPLVLLVAYLLFFRDTGSVDVLVFSKTDGFRHASIEPGVEAIKKMGQEHGFRVGATEDAAIFKEQVLRNFNVVVFLNTTGDVLNEAPQVVLAMNGNRSFFWDGVPIDYAVNVSDTEDGSVAGGGIAPEDVVVTLDYLPQGADLIEPALGHQALMDGSDCAACHQQDEASVGPSYRRIAERYQGDEGAVEQLVQKVIEGRSGAWGDLAMAPHPQLSTQETAKMIEYVLSLAEGAEPTCGLPLEDAYLPTVHRSQDGEGSYVLMATYTDRGGRGVGPLTAREVITLRPPHVAARDYAHAGGGGIRFTIPEGRPAAWRGRRSSSVCMERRRRTRTST